MKYLKKYHFFSEEVGYEVKNTDKPDVKLAKEKMNTVNDQFKEYNEKKPIIDTLYSKSPSTEKEISDGLKEILGDADVQEGADRNPFLVEYVGICSIEKEVYNLQDKNAKDKLTLDDFNQELSLSKEDSTKKLVSFKISDIKNRMSKNAGDIVKKMADIQKRQTELKTKMDNIQREISLNIKKINDIKQK